MLKTGDDVKLIEDGWMMSWSTVYPYGLNARVDTKKIVDSQIKILNNEMCIYTLFEQLISTRTGRGGGGVVVLLLQIMMIMKILNSTLITSSKRCYLRKISHLAYVIELVS